MTPHILALDSSGSPRKWISMEDAAVYYAKNQVIWAVGQNEFTLNGGVSRKTGERSYITTNSIIAVRGPNFVVKKYERTPTVNRELLFARDLQVCGYCGNKFKTIDLEMEHIHPQSRGGPTTWTNLVTACRRCNDRKANKTPEEARMPLLYVPYIPNRHESLILMNRRILADQMDFLLLNVPKHSRLNKQ